MAENEMIERVAQAILAKVPLGYGMTIAESDEYARAAIEAMREPTEAMVDAFVWYGHGKTIGDVARIGWQSMIDAALSPEIEG